MSREPLHAAAYELNARRGPRNFSGKYSPCSIPNILGVIEMTEAPDEKDELLARYVLNELSEGENEDLEDEMVLDEELAERRQTVEMNLIDSYVMDEMSPGERLRFENGFLLFPENRLKVEEARMLHDNLRLLRKESPGDRGEPSPSFPEPAAQSWRRWLTLFPAPAYAAAALLLALGLGYFLIPWRNIFKGRTDNGNVAVNLSPRATPGVITTPEVAPNVNDPGNLNSNQDSPTAPNLNTSEQPEVALSPGQPETVRVSIIERPAPVGDVKTRGPETGRAAPQSVRIARGSKLLRLTVRLRQDRAVENDTRLAVKVYNVNDLDSPVFPRRGNLLLKPGRVGTGKPRYSVTVEIPTSNLRDGKTYYLRIDEEAEATSFKVTMINAER